MLSHHFFSYPLLYFAAACLLGLIVGSFLNVVIFRLPIMLTQSSRQAAREILGLPVPQRMNINLWRPRSACLHCQIPLPLISNIPIFSYLHSKGKTRCCNKQIPADYLWVELSTGVLAFLLAEHFGINIKFFCAFILSCSLLTLTFIDLKHLILPNQITLPLLWIGLFLNIFSIFSSLTDAVLGAIYGYLFFYAIDSLFFKIRGIHGLGHGDFKLISALGAWFGWQALPVIILIASFTGAAYGTIYIIAKNQKRSTLLPFAPFLALGGLIILFFNPEMAYYQRYISHFL